MAGFRSQVRRAFSAFGLDLRIASPTSSPTKNLVSTLRFLGCDLVFDVGANTGQFGAELREGGFEGHIVSFEPLSSAHQALVARASGDQNWTVYPRVAIGDRTGSIEINVSANSVSSSILPMLGAHSDAAQYSRYVGREMTDLRRLDEIALEKSGFSRPFLKVDTQGFEWQVLDGAPETLRKVCGVQCEVSFVPLYDGQRLWREIFSRPDDLGFSIWSIDRGFTDPRTGRTLQADVSFVRRDLVPS